MAEEGPHNPCNTGVDLPDTEWLVRWRQTAELVHVGAATGIDRA